MIPAQQPDERMERLLRRVGRRRWLARLVLLVERAWPALWPAIGAAGLFLCLALLDLLPRLPGWAHAAVLGLAGLAVLALLLRGARRLALPDAAAADRRLEQASGLAHRPLAVLADRPAVAPGQAGGEVLWRAHVARAAAQLGRLRAGLPHPGMAGRDPRALRLGLVVALAACLGIAGAEAPGRVLRALKPVFVPPPTVAAAQVQAWITPPAHTGLAPVFLRADTAGASVPHGARLSVNLTGGSGAPTLTLGTAALPFRALDGASFQAEEDLATGGRLAIGQGGRTLAAWDITVVPNVAPVVRFPEPPGIARGRVPVTRLPWEVSHPYGVVALQAELTLRDRPDAPALVLPIPLPGSTSKAARGVRLHDLTAHPWAGLAVSARLVGREATGLAGHSEDMLFELPERRFLHPVALALLAQRKALTLRPQERRPVTEALDGLSVLEDTWDNDLRGFLALRGIAALLRRGTAEGTVAEAQERMWQLALQLEEGAPERTARALEQARQAVRELLEQERRGERIDQAELERRLRELQEALQRHLQALAEQARRDPATREFNPDRNPLDARDMQRMAEELREAGREGRMDEARDRLSELEKMIEEMKNARNEQGKLTERQKQRAEKRQRGQQQMNALQDMVMREGGVLDNAQRRAGQEEPRLGFQPRRPARPPADAQQLHAERQHDRLVQQALRRALGELMQQQGDLTGKIPPQLGEADTAMREAIQALRDGRDAPAAAAAQRAIEALQKGGRQMGQEMAQQFGRPGDEEGSESGDQEGDGSQMTEGDQDGEGGGPGRDQANPGNQRGDRWGERGWGRGRYPPRRADDRRDPLGRQLKEGTAGSDESGDVQVPEEMEEARTRAIQEELRRRGAERGRPQPELDYIDRLLRQF